MYERILMTSESDETNLSRLARFEQRRVCTFFSKDAMRIFVAQNLVMLDQIDMIGLQPFERLVQLFCRILLCAAVDLRHQKDALAITILERLAHALFARAFVVVPAVVHEVDPVVDRGANDAQAQLLVNRFETEMPAAQTDERDFH